MCEHGAMDRRRMGPTGRQAWLILVDYCLHCGLLYAVRPLVYAQSLWLMRYNARVKAIGRTEAGA